MNDSTNNIISTCICIFAVIGIYTVGVLILRSRLCKYVLKKVYALFKYTGLSLVFDIFICIIQSIKNNFTIIRINPFFIYNKQNRCINQSLSFKGLCLVIKNNYFKNRKEALIELCSVNEDIIKKLANENVVIHCETNILVYESFKKNFSEYISENSIIEDNKIDLKNQKLERLSLVTTRCLLKSIVNKKERNKMKKFLNKEMQTKRYYLKLQKI